jgi:site-specific DNA-methyltransferase (adenine-specific)
MTAKSARSANIELVWPGKTAVVRPAPLELEAIERNTARRAEHGPTDESWTNLLVHGDNARVLATLQEGDCARRIAAAGGVKLVYLDPPFGVGTDFALDGSAWLGAPGLAYRDRWDESGVDGAASHLQWLFTRLTLARDILRDDGVLYLHVDQRVSAHARLILDEVFGSAAFRGWIVWKVGSGAKSRTRWSNEHNDILCYAKGEAMTFHTDAASMREPFAATSRAMHFNAVDGAGRRHRVRVVNGKEYRYFEDDGRVVGSVWADCPSMAANSPILAESTGWPTQKPEALLTRILESSTDEGDLVLELCCGSGTTPAVAEKLGRRWIAIDASAQSVHTTRKRLVRVQGERSGSLFSSSARSFDVLRVRPERHSSANGNDADATWIGAVCAAYGATGAPQGLPWNAQRADVPVVIAAPALVLGAREIERLAGLFVQQRGAQPSAARLEVLARAFDDGAVPASIDMARTLGAEVALKRIPEQLDGRDPFLAEAAITARWRIGSDRAGGAEGARLELEHLRCAALAADEELAERTLLPGRTCIAYADGRILQLTRNRRGRLTTVVVAETWTDAIDAWGIAPIAAGSAPCIDWIAMRSRHAREFDLSCAAPRANSSHGALLVRVVDVFAREFDAVVPEPRAPARDFDLSADTAAR